MNSKRLAKAGLALGLIGGTAAGFALSTPGVSGAQTGSTTPSTPATTPADPSADHEAQLRETLKPLLDNGTLTQAQVDAVVGALKAAAPVGDHRGGPRGGGADLSIAASTIGVTAADLRTALQSGQSIADVAKSKNVDPQAVIDAMVAAMKQRLAESVTAGKLTQAKADELATASTTRITDLVNGVAQPGGPGFGFGHGGPRGRGPAPAAPATPAAPTTTTG